MSKHRKTDTGHVSPLLGGALLAGGMLMLAPVAMASAAPHTNAASAGPIKKALAGIHSNAASAGPIKKALAGVSSNAASAGPIKKALAAPALTLPTITRTVPGINGRHPVLFPQPVVDQIQLTGDAFFAAAPNLQQTGLGAAYNGLFGMPESAAGLGDGTQGLVVGALNTFPRILACNIAIQVSC